MIWDRSCQSLHSSLNYSFCLDKSTPNGVKIKHFPKITVSLQSAVRQDLVFMYKQQELIFLRQLYMYIELYIHVILTLLFFPHKPFSLSSNNAALTPLSTFQRAIKLRKKLIQISRVGLIALFFPTTSIRLNMQGRIFLFFVLIFSLSNFFIFNACLSVFSSDICVLSCCGF